MVLVEPPESASATGYSAAVASETTSSPAVKMTAATVTESPQPLNSMGASSVEDASEAVAPSSGFVVKKLMNTEVPTMASAATAAETANAAGGPVAALAIAERLSEEEEFAAAANKWPHWFMPGALLVLAAGFLIFAVRMMAPSHEPLPVQVPEEHRAPPAATAAEQPAPSPPETASTEETKPEPPVNKPAAAATVQQEPKPRAERPAKAAPQPQAESKPQPAAPPREKRSNVDNPFVMETPAPEGGPEASKVPPPPEPTAPAAALPTKTLQRVAPRPVNVDAHLADTLSGIEVRQMPLWAYFDLVSELSSIPITLDAEAVTELGQSASVPVRVKLGETTVAGALDAVLEPLHLGYQVHDGQLVVGYSPQENMRQVRYAVGDLTDSDDRARGIGGTRAADGGARVVAASRR